MKVAGFGLDEVDRHIDVAAGRFGIRTGLVSFIDQGPGDFAFDAGEADIETSAQEIAAVRKVQFYFRVDGEVSGKRDLLLASRDPHCAFEAGGPTSGEQLLRIGPDPPGARR